jgi:ATP synthase protein I
VSDTDPNRKMEELEAKLDALKKAQQPEKSHQEEHYSQANMAWRMVTEMVAGLGIGFGIGYGLDALFGTSPFLMVLFTLLGIGAGINVMLRTAKEFQQKANAPTGAEDMSPSGAGDKGDGNGD